MLQTHTSSIRHFDYLVVAPREYFTSDWVGSADEKMADQQNFVLYLS